jgi:menaquinol-cytochrome c reductase iron-sulfur subunit
MSEEQLLSRRALLATLGTLANVCIGAALAIPVVAYLVSPLLKRHSYLQWISLGQTGQFPEGQTRFATFRNPANRPWDGATDQTACWVRHIAGDDFQVFAVNCAHLGCPVRWFPQSQLFMCPCHGGAYYADGTRAAGPPLRGLFEYPSKIQGGELMIQAGELPTLSTPA